MTLRTKVGSVIALLILVVGGIGGLLSLLSYYRLAVSRLDTALNTCARAIQQQGGDGIGAALFAVRTQEVLIGVAFRSLDGVVTSVRDDANIITAKLPLATLRAAAAEPVTVTAPHEIRLRTVRLADDEYVILAASLQQAQRERTHSLQLLTLTLLGAAFFGVALSRLVTRPDLNAIDDLTRAASEIAAGRPVLFDGATRGGTEVVRLHAALQSMSRTVNDALEESRAANAHLRDFLADASHELRTPLTVLMGYTDLLKHHDRLEPEVRDRAIERCTQEIVRMEALVTDLLLLARLQESAPQLDAEVDLCSLVQDELAKLQDLQPDRSTRFETDGSCLIRGDARALASFCSNAFANIKNHTAPEDAVLVTLRRYPGVVALCIDDAGPGLPEALTQSAQGTFTRFNTLLSRETGGFGLGLHLMQRVATAHGGRLHLAKGSLGGARIVLEVPTSAPSRGMFGDRSDDIPWTTDLTQRERFAGFSDEQDRGQQQPRPELPGMAVARPSGSEELQIQA